MNIGASAKGREMLNLLDPRQRGQGELQTAAPKGRIVACGAMALRGCADQDRPDFSLEPSHGFRLRRPKWIEGLKHVRFRHVCDLAFCGARADVNGEGALPDVQALALFHWSLWRPIYSSATCANVRSARVWGAKWEPAETPAQRNAPIFSEL